MGTLFPWSYWNLSTPLLRLLPFRKRDGCETFGVPRRSSKRSVYRDAAEARGVEGKVSLSPGKIPRTSGAIHDVTEEVLPHWMCVVSEAHSLGAQGALGTWWDQSWYLSPLRGAPPHAAVSQGLMDPQPSPGWQSGAMWCWDPAPKTHAQNSHSKYYGWSAPTPPPGHAASASAAGTRRTQSW